MKSIARIKFKVGPEEVQIKRLHFVYMWYNLFVDRNIHCGL